MSVASVRRTRALRRTVVPAAGAAVLVVGTALPALAHVTVSSPDAAPGGFGKLVFRVPTESDTASTTRLRVTLPRATPFAFVSTKPVPGWSVSTTQRALAEPLKVEGFTLTKTTSTVTWTARRGAGIEPGQFDEFELSVGPFPTSSGALALPAVQTYSDGTVVRWNQPTKEGAPEPEHPAPTLELTDQAAAAAAAADDDSTQADETAEPAAAPAAATTPDDTDTLGRWLGGAGLLVGLVALGVAVSRGRGRAGSA